MSESLEKEGTVSTLVSVLATWIALGAGLALLCFAFLSVYLQTEKYAPSKEYGNTISDYLTGDLASAKLDTLNISDDGKTLKFLRRRAGDGNLFPVIYALSEKENVLTRETGDAGTTELGQHTDLRFARKGKMLEATWTGHRSKVNERWTLDRWGNS